MGRRRDPPRLDCRVWHSAGALHGLEERVCATAESGGARDRRRTADPIRPHVRDAGDQDYSRELAAGEGRIERNHGTHQDRLVKKLRRQRIADIEAANVFLDGYWAEHNRRFAQRPASADDFHVAVSRALRLDQVFRLEETRTVSNDWVVRYENRYLQIERQSHRPPARSSVTVYEASTGQLEIRYRDRVMRWTEIPAPGSRAAAPVALASRPTAEQAPVRRRSGQLPDHPWRSSAIEQHYAYQQFIRDRRAWEREQP